MRTAMLRTVSICERDATESDPGSSNSNSEFPRTERKRVVQGMANVQHVTAQRGLPFQRFDWPVRRVGRRASVCP